MTAQAHEFWKGAGFLESKTRVCLYDLLWRLYCRDEFCRHVVLQAVDVGRRWRNKAENVGMKNDVEINYKLSIFPYRELVSDFVRARQVPYCNVPLAYCN